MTAHSFVDLAQRLREGRAVVAGVLSGTSGDGIDVGLARFEDRAGKLALAEALASEVRPFPAGLDARVRAVLDGEPCGLREVALLGRDLGRAFGRAAREVAEAHGVTLDLVGSHGQTVWHHDGEEQAGKATLQLGDGDFVAESAGCAVVSDFRARDIAAGGDGAPLSAYADDLLFAALEEPFCVLNLGGMANVSYFADGRVLAFDTGPCNSLLDGLARRLLDQPFDSGGGTALAGAELLPAPPADLPSALDPLGLRLLESQSPRGDRIRRWCGELSRHPFFLREPPKSTGRDTFGEAWVDRAVEAGGRLGLEPVPDLFVGAVRFIAGWVDVAARRFLPDGPEPTWVAAGGGVRNAALMAALGATRSVRPSSSVGVDPDAREALVFAALAARTLVGEPVTRPGTTGARAGRVLGKLSPAPPAR
ncbi:MAG: anhydro-N-acetylmuramic acid kinase [bacterium]|nr:anhydro-N-acetylmuramic acid kinase [bacterium]